MSDRVRGPGAVALVALGVLAALAVATYLLTPLANWHETGASVEGRSTSARPPDLPPEPERSASRGHVVTYFEEALPSTMNPLFASTMVDHRTHELVFDRLFFRSPVTNDIGSRVLASYDTSADGRSVHMTLLEGIRWHDGQPLVAQDICFTLNALLDPATGSPMGEAIRDLVRSCEVDGVATATVVLNRPRHDVYDRLSVPLVPAHAFEEQPMTPDHSFSWRPVGTGPMQASVGRRAISMTAAPNPHHQPTVPTLRLLPGGDAFIQARILTEGLVDGIISIPPALRPELSASDRVHLKTYDLHSWWFIALNTHRGTLRDRRVREALEQSIDRTLLRDLTIGHDATDPTPPCEFISGPFLPSSPYYDRAIPASPSADLAQVESLMTQAGARRVAGLWEMDGQPITLDIGLYAPLDAEARDILNQVGNQVLHAGFQRRVSRIASDVWSTEAVTGNLIDTHDLLIGKWSFGLVEDVDDLFHTRDGEGRGALNLFDYSNPEVDALLGQFRQARTDTEAQAAYHELHAELARELPYIFLWKLDTKTAWRNEVHGNTVAPYFYFTAFDGWRYDG